MVKAEPSAIEWAHQSLVGLRCRAPSREVAAAIKWTSRAIEGDKVARITHAFLLREVASHFVREDCIQMWVRRAT